MKIHVLQGYIQSIFLIEYSQGILILDGACRVDAKLIKDFIEIELKRSIKDLKLIVSTHMHPDHVGGAKYLQKKYQTKVAAKKMLNQWYGGVAGFFDHKLDILLTYYVGHRKTGTLKNIHYYRKLIPDFELEDGDSLPFFKDWVVFHTPGHTDRDLSLFNKESGDLYVADNIVKIKERYLSPYPLHFPDKYKASIDRYLSLDYKRILLAHGGICEIDRERLEKIKKFSPDYVLNHKSITRKFLLRKLKVK